MVGSKKNLIQWWECKKEWRNCTSFG